MSDEGFVWRRRVSFGDCDPARIAYTGRIPEFALEAIDAFWEDLLDGVNWFRMYTDQELAIPFVRMEMTFKKPVTPRAPLFCRVEPVALGNSSMTFEVTGSQDDIACFVAQFVCVFVTSTNFGKIPVPPPIRAKLESRFPALCNQVSKAGLCEE